MERVYPALFTRSGEVVLVEVPDLSILSEGKDLFNAYDMAKDAICLKCISMEDDGEKIPEPTDIKEIDIEKGVFAKDGETVVACVVVDTEEYRNQLSAQI